jgi:hypothetical protein
MTNETITTFLGRGQKEEQFLIVIAMIARVKHGQDLKTVFNLDPNTDPVQLSKRLFRLENKAHRLALDFCNGNIDQLTWDNEASKILDKVQAIFKNKKNIFVNGDARGYALKIDDDILGLIISISIEILAVMGS